MEIDIESPNVAEQLGKALGIKIVGWANHKARTLDDELAQMGLTELGPNLRDIRK